MAQDAHSPLAQFEIKPLVPLELFGYDISFTNSAAWMLAAVMIAVGILTLGMRHSRLIPGRWQSIAELSYEFIGSLVRNNMGHSGRRFFPLIFSIFLFVLLGNLLGMIPFSFTFTSHFIVNFALAAFLFSIILVVGFARHGIRFLGLFAPSGVPLPVLLLLVPIEIFSFLVRPVTLALRLFINMTAGHTMLKVFAGFVVGLVLAEGIVGPVAAIGPLAAIVALTALEIGIALLQAYIFTILACIYLGEALELHH